MNLRNVVVATALVFAFIFAPPVLRAQDFPPNLLTALPHSAELLSSNDVADRVSILNELIHPVPKSDTLEQSLPFTTLTKSDYAFVVARILEKDLNVLDEKRGPEAWFKLSHLVRKFELKEFTPRIAGYLSSSNSRTQGAVLSLLSSLDASNFDAEIAQLLSSDQRYLREEALRVLIKFKSVRAVPTLITLLDDANSTMRWWALQSLVTVNGRGASFHVAKLLQDPEPDIRYWALDTLVKLDAKERAADIWFLAAGQRLETEAYAIAALVYFGDAKAIDLAMTKIADGVDPENNITPKTTLSGTILNRITELKAKAIVPRLIALLENPPPASMHPLFGRTDIVYALGKLEAKESSPVLRSYLHQYPRGRTPVIQVLGDFRDADSVDDLFDIFLTYLPKPAGEVTNDNYLSTEAAVALAKIGDSRTWKALLDASENPRFPYRSFVIEELNRHINRKLWDRVAEAKVAGKDFANIKENVELFSKELNVPIDLEYDPYQHFFRFHKPGVIPQLRISPGQNLRAALKDVVSAIDSGTLPNRFTYIMDHDRIRILPVEDAIKWWRANVLKSETTIKVAKAN